MPNKHSLYFYIDVDLSTMKVVDWGEAETANLTGKTNKTNVNRVFLTRGQYNKFKKSID